jgi:hypothetical protein
LPDGQPRAAVPTKSLDTLRKVSECPVEKVVKRGEGVDFAQVVENVEKINPKKCHSCPMQYDIIVL